MFIGYKGKLSSKDEEKTEVFNDFLASMFCNKASCHLQEEWEAELKPH